MSTTINRGRVAPRTEYFDAESILSPIAKTTDKGPATQTANKMEKVLICLDGPWMAEAALSYIEDYIARLAPEVKVEIYLLQVITEIKHYRIGDGTVTTVPFTGEEIKQTMDETVDYLNKAAELLRSKRATVIAKVGIGTDASKEIVKIAEEIGATLIVMFKQTKSWLDHLTFGSVTDKVLRREKSIPVMAVRAENLMDQLDYGQVVKSG